MKMEKDNPICPLITTNTVVGENGQVSIDTQPVICVNEKCAWWLKDKQRCAIAVIANKYF